MGFNSAFKGLKMKGFRALRCPICHHGVDRDKFILYCPLLWWDPC